MELETENERLSKFFMQAPAGICILEGEELVFAMINPRYQQLFPGRILLGKKLLDAVPEIKDQPVWNILQEVYHTGETFEGNELLITLAKTDHEPVEDRYFNFIYQAKKDKNGIVDGILVFVFEVTELVAARNKLQEAQDILNISVDAANVGTWSAEINSGRLELSDRSYHILGIPDGLNLTISEASKMIFPEDRDLVLANIKLSVYNKRKFENEYWLNPMDGGSPKRIKSNGKAYYNDHGMPLYITGAFLDITDQVTTEQKLTSLNDDLSAINEELACSNEELLTSNEELEDRERNIKKLLVQLTESEKQFKFLLNAIPQQVWTAQSNGKLNYVNQVVCDDFGQPMENIIEQGWQAFIHPDDLFHCLKTWRTALDSGKEYVVEFRLLFTDSTYKWHLARAVPFVEDGKTTLWLGTNTNIDQQKINESKKDEFLSIASHELKTPLTSIKAFNQLMLRTSDPARLQGFVKKSSDNILRLEKLISDLLDVTKINAGKMSYNMQEFNFREMLKESIEAVQYTSPSHRIILNKEEDFVFNGDRFRIEQVVTNFLTNAIKYSPSGKEVIVNSYVQFGSLIVSVQDFGIGIAAHELTRLFERYYRVDNTTMRFEGLGLGLFISSEILKRHHGSFWIESELGVGSTFFFRLPVSGSPIQPEMNG